MNTRELFEMASLDVLGLLDEDERSSFERAFRAADPATQAQVRREQRRFADLEGTLPEVDAPTGLRGRVVNAVREAIASVRTEPVGRIGRHGVSMVSGSAPIWRAACIGFATASMVLAGFAYSVSQQNRTIADGLRNNVALEQMRQIAGPVFVSMMGDPSTRMVSMRPAEAAPDLSMPPGANLVFNTKRSEQTLVCQNLPMIAGNYSLVLDRRDGSVPQTLVEFSASAGTATAPVRGLKWDDVPYLQLRAPAAVGQQSLVLVPGS
ncbi:MAG TPA: hypothetical protein DEB06_05475 [Phycisphaerales bacterium]|nr:hypothetical protein [Phycisphaerales bacterium]